MFKKDFIFSVAQIRALESRLLTQPQVERMVAAPNAKEAFKILNDLDWANFLGEADKPEEFSAVLDAGLLEVQRLINGTVDMGNDFDFMWFLFDLQNAKVFIKSLLKTEGGEEEKNLLSPLGSISRDTMRRIVYEKEIVKGFEWILDLVKECKAEYKKHHNPEKVEILIEKAFFEKILKQVKKTTSLMRKFFAKMVDIKNLLSFLRKADFKEEKNLDFFIEGGEIKKEFLLNLKSFSDLTKEMPIASIQKILENHIVNDKIESYLELEKALDEDLFHILAPTKWEPMGPDPVFAYFWQKKRNAEIIRAILVGKLNNVPEKQLRSWLKKPSITL